MTPVFNQRNEGEVRYNIIHRRTRCIIERCFGILRKRFPCLYSGLRNALQNSLVIFVAATVLHNFALMQKEVDFDEDIEDEEVPFDIVVVADAGGNAGGNVQA